METIDRAGIIEQLRPGDIPGATKLFSLIESNNLYEQLYGLSKLRDLLQFEYHSNLTCPPGLRKEVTGFIEQLAPEIKKLSESLNPVLHTSNFIEVLLSDEIIPNRKTIKLGSLCEELAFIEKVKLDLSDIAEEHRKSPEYNRSDYLEPFEVCKESDPLHFGTPFRIVTDFEQLLNQIGKEIEQEQEQPAPQTLARLIWTDKQEVLSELIGYLVYSGSFKDIDPGAAGIKKVVEILNNVFEPPLNPDSVVTQFSKQFKKDLPFTTELKKWIEKARETTLKTYNPRKRLLKKRKN